MWNVASDIINCDKLTSTNKDSFTLDALPYALRCNAVPFGTVYGTATKRIASAARERKFRMCLGLYPEVSCTSQNDHNVELEITVVVSTANLHALVSTSGVLESGADSTRRQAAL